MVNISVPCVETLTWHLAAPGIDETQCLYNIVTPYNLLTWGIALCKSRLLYSFPCLIFDLTYSTPIRNPHPLTHTFIPLNLRSAEIDPSCMAAFMAAEVTSGRMDGPFVVPQAHSIFGSHFHTHTPSAWLKNWVPVPFISFAITPRKTTLANPQMAGLTQT